MKRILVGLDGSESSLRAMALASEVARRFEAKLTLVTVVPPLLLPNDAYAVGVSDIEQEHRRHAERIIHGSAAKLSDGGKGADQAIVFGAPAESLAELALSDDVEMVVVGSHGRSMVARMLLGSVSHRLLHICEKPVLVVR